MGLPACLSTLVLWEGVQVEKVDDAEAQGLTLLCSQRKAVLHSRWETNIYSIAEYTFAF